MSIEISELAGFCFGVSNAVDKALEVAENNKSVYTLGELIHNEQVLQKLRSLGVNVLNSADEAQKDDKVIIRAHGVSRADMDILKKNKAIVIDATCPYVKRIHNLVSNKQSEGYEIVIVGDKNHPEVIGINGWCKNKAYIINTEQEAKALEYIENKAIIVAQTTIKRETFEKVCEITNKKFAKLIKFDTICSATAKRQKEALQLAKQSDIMIIIGGKKSSNTQKLYEICQTQCDRVFKIESVDEMTPFKINKNDKIGITAGASTPKTVIKEVFSKMEDMVNNQTNEISFEEAFEQSMVTLRSGEIVKGKVIGYNTNEVFIDLGYKADGVIPMEEFLNQDAFDPEVDLKKETEIDVYIVKINDGEGNVLLSKKRVDSIKGMKELEVAYKEKTPITAKVKEVVKGGVVTEVKGVRIFIPASQLSDRYIKNLDEYKNKEIKFEITEYTKSKRRVVGSCRTIIEKEKAIASEDFWSSIEVGKEFTGNVKSVTDFGVFVDLGVVDGLIHISELSWNKINHPSEVLKSGDNVSVRVIEFDKDKKRVSLGYRKAEENPWYNVEEKYQVGDIKKGKVVRLVPFGVFVELEEGVEGLVHISKISDVRLGKPDEVLSVGQEVEMKIIEVDGEYKKISLSIKDVKPINPEGVEIEEQTETKEKVKEHALPSEHKEEMSNTIGDMLKDINI